MAAEDEAGAEDKGREGLDEGVRWKEACESVEMDATKISDENQPTHILPLASSVRLVFHMMPQEM